MKERHISTRERLPGDLIGVDAEAFIVSEIISTSDRAVIRFFAGANIAAKMFRNLGWAARLY